MNATKRVNIYLKLNSVHAVTLLGDLVFTTNLASTIDIGSAPTQTLAPEELVLQTLHLLQVLKSISFSKTAKVSKSLDSFCEFGELGRPLDPPDSPS